MYWHQEEREAVSAVAGGDVCCRAGWEGSDGDAVARGWGGAGWAETQARSCTLGKEFPCETYLDVSLEHLF